MWQSAVMVIEIETSCRGIVFLHRTTEEHISPSCHDGAQKSNGNGTHKTRGRGALRLEAPAKQMEASRHTCGSTMETYVGTTCKLKIECVHCAIEAKRSVLGRPGTSRANAATGGGNSLRTQTRLPRDAKPSPPCGRPAQVRPEGPRWRQRCLLTWLVWGLHTLNRQSSCNAVEEQGPIVQHALCAIP